MDPLTVPGTLDSLSVIRAFVDRAVEAAGLERKAGYRLRLAVDEIATNVITHGYEESGREGEIRLEASIDDEALTIAMDDDGVPYDPTEADEPDDLHLPLEQRGIGGLGIFLTVNGIDDFRYERRGEHNRNTFVMRRPGTQPEETS